MRCIRVEEIGVWDINRGTVPDADPDRKRDVILSVEGLDVFYGRKQVVHDVTLRPGEGRGGGAGRRVRQRQDHDLPLRRRPAQGVDRHASRSRAASWPTSARKRSAEDRRRIQYIFQNPYLSLNPRLTIEQIIKRPMELFGIAKGKQATDRVLELHGPGGPRVRDAALPGQPALRW